MLIIFLVVLVLLLGVMLWSSRTQRLVRVSLDSKRGLDNIRHPVTKLTDGSLTPGNAVEVLQNGDGFFPRLIEDIEQAQQYINIESYVWWKGQICTDVADALIAQAQRGLEVCLLLDWVGSYHANKDELQRLRDGGVQLTRYHPPELRSLGRFNKRSHRKLAVFDAKIAYVHSFGIAEEWEGNGVGPDNWRDTGVRLQGPIVNDVQGAFAKNWMEATGEVIAEPAYYPEQPEVGDSECHLVISSPRGGVSSVSLLLRMLINAAEHQLIIQNPYFCPDDDWIEALAKAVKNGVDVQIMVPGEENDSKIVLRAGQYRYEELLEAGCRIFLHRNNLLHQKIMIVDDLWSHVGSTNFDERSFDINAESSLGIVDAEVAKQLKNAWLDDLKQCKEVHLDEWRQRDWQQRLKEKVAFQFRKLI